MSLFFFVELQKNKGRSVAFRFGLCSFFGQELQANRILKMKAITIGERRKTKTKQEKQHENCISPGAVNTVIRR